MKNTYCQEQDLHPKIVQLKVYMSFMNLASRGSVFEGKWIGRKIAENPPLT